MPKVKPEDFKDWAEQDHMDCTVQWDGRYHGRNFHKGYAIVIPSIGELGVAMASMRADPRVAPLGLLAPHTDNMGMGYVASWDLRHFEPVDKATAMKLEEGTDA